MSSQSNRREFLRTAGAAAAAFAIVPAHVMAAPGRTGANSRINVGYIGVGRRAGQLMQLPEGGQIIAFADVNMDRLKAHQQQHAGTDIYQDYREMLERDDLDAVVIATPDHWHTVPAVHACEAEKDVYVEKPLTLTVDEGRKMVEAARKHNRVFQTGSQQRSMQETRRGCELVRNQVVGEIHTVHGANYPSPWECILPEQPVPEGLDWDMWCGQTEPRPYHIDLYLPRAQGRTNEQGRLGWISFRPYSGGEMTGWGSHGLDVIQWALGTDKSGPVEVWPEGEGLTAPVSFRYANGVLVTLDGKGPGGGAVFEGKDGAIMVDRGKYEVKPKDLEQNMPEDGVQLEESNDHMGNWFDCIRTRETPIADVEIGHRSATLCHLCNIARWTGRKLQWNPEAERFVDDDDANTYLQREMRKPYGY